MYIYICIERDRRLEDYTSLKNSDSQGLSCSGNDIYTYTHTYDHPEVDRIWKFQPYSNSSKKKSRFYLLQDDYIHV